MKKIAFIILFIQLISIACAQNPSENMKSNYKKLTPAEARVILDKGTEAPFIGKYNDFYEPGTYVCKQCGEQEVCPSGLMSDCESSDEEDPTD